ncbi:hypothetical protein FACS1894184_16970 [Clostridia bacterium]|nr:hypothetical protein FACS1894184_16970 [Clostridia bacterium]
MKNVFDVARCIIDAMKTGDEPTVTNLMLHKLLFFAQGHCLARTGKPLFDSPIEAWKLGPVAPEIYRAYKPFGHTPIILPTLKTDECGQGKEDEILLDVLCEYGKYSSNYLVSLTHKQGSPWANTARNSVISYETMMAYFRKPENQIESFDSVISRLSQDAVTVLPKEWYDPNEDALWESYR